MVIIYFIENNISILKFKLTLNIEMCRFSGLSEPRSKYGWYIHEDTSKC